LYAVLSHHSTRYC